MEPDTSDRASRPSSTGRHVYQVNGQEIVLTDQDRLYVETLHEILHGRITETSLVSLEMGIIWCAHTHLIIEYQHVGTNTFWDIFGFMIVKYPQLADWRPLIEKGPQCYRAQTDMPLLTRLFESSAQPERSLPAEPQILETRQDSEPPEWSRPPMHLENTDEQPEDEEPEDEQLEGCGIRLDQVVHEDIYWLWKDHIALGKITILDGDPGVGKSSIMLDLAARVSTGRLMPNGTPGIIGEVILIMPEDGLSDTIRPKLVRAGANLNRLRSLGSITLESQFFNRAFNLVEDFGLLEHVLASMDVRLIIIDPIMATLGGKDTYKDNEVRMLLSPLQLLIERFRTACVLVRHLNKGGGENMLYRGGGSIAFIGLARSAFSVALDSEDKTQSLLAPIKTNIGKPPPAIAFRITSDDQLGDERPYVTWGAERYIDPNGQNIPAPDKVNSILK